SSGRSSGRSSAPSRSSCASATGARGRNPAAAGGAGEGASVVISERLYWALLGVLAVWRVTHLLQAEDGPWDVVVRLRRAAGAGFFGRLLDCFYCLSLWVALPAALAIGTDAFERLLLWPAL